MWWSDGSDIDLENYIIATYEVSADNLSKAAWAIAVGQSIGNPYLRNSWESSNLIDTHGCVIFGDENELSNQTSGKIKIGFPTNNINLEEDGINHLLCQLMGGHTDINEIHKCRLIDLQFPKNILGHFRRPARGIEFIRGYTGRQNMPLAGGIIKPKIGFTREQYTTIVSMLMDAGIDFIKEDEIISDPHYFPLSERVKIVSKLRENKNCNVVFCHTINADPHKLLQKVQMVYELGGNGIHLNILGGLGSYYSVRDLDLPLFMHLQSSGAKIMTDAGNRYSISWQVLCYLASLIGVDSVQVGMIGGYSNDNETDVLESIEILRRNNTLPALSCGLTPGLINSLNEKIGVDYLANSGGNIHSHPVSSYFGAKRLRDAIDGRLHAE